MKEINYTPKSRPVPAYKIRVGQIVMESNDHPARVTRISAIHGELRIYSRYVWQTSKEPDWLFGKFDPWDDIERAR